MHYRIPSEVLQQATGCTKDLKCLSCNPNELCEIQFYPEGDGIHFVKCTTGTDCPFLETDAKAKVSICNCPVRKEIYRRYSV